MPDLNCEISYPGAISIASADYTLLHGIAPGVVRMSCNAVDDVALGGTVTLGDGRQRLVLTGCRVDRCEIDASSSGYTATLYLFDKRWRWKLGQINGHYNEPSPRIYDVPRVVAPGQQAGNQPATEPPEKLPDIQEPTRKNARDLAKLLLETMGERTYDIAAIPSNDYPEVKWEAAVPAVELQNLAERYGCRVVYRPDVDGVLIAKLGVGAQLPDGLLDSDNLGIDPPEPPGRIVVYGAPVRYQVRFELEAVGLDFDGVVRPIDDLSYTPAQGWESAGPPFPFSPGTQFLDPPQNPRSPLRKPRPSSAQPSPRPLSRRPSPAWRTLSTSGTTSKGAARGQPRALTWHTPNASKLRSLPASAPWATSSGAWLSAGTSPSSVLQNARAPHALRATTGLWGAKSPLPTDPLSHASSNSSPLQKAPTRLGAKHAKHSTSYPERRRARALLRPVA